jgi:hypothetical protein
MELSETQKRARAVLDVLNAGLDFPVHVAKRLGALVAGEPVVYADDNLEYDADRRATGTVVLLTSTRVIAADLQASGGGRSEPGDGATTATCRTWGRCKLETAETLDVDGRNRDWIWHNEWTASWPRGAVLTLNYAGGETLQLPLSESRETSFATVVDDVLADVSR